MIKYKGWWVLPGEIVITEKEYECFRRRYEGLTDKVKAEIEQAALTEPQSRHWRRNETL